MPQHRRFLVGFGLAMFLGLTGPLVIHRLAWTRPQVAATPTLQSASAPQREPTAGTVRSMDRVLTATPPGAARAPSTPLVPTLPAVADVPNHAAGPPDQADRPPAAGGLGGDPHRGPLATAVVRASAVEALAATAPRSLTPTAPLRTILDERFADNQRGWPDDLQATAWLADGSYRLIARQPGQFVAVGAPLGTGLGDVVAIATFHKVGGPPGGGYGLIVRDQGPGPRDGRNQTGRFYVFEVGDRGDVGVWRRQTDQWIDIVPWTPSSAVQPGEALNQLRVEAIGPQLTFLVNGTQVARVRDEELAEGAVGIFAGGDFNDVALDRLVVQAPG
jgi:hypothetical protein